MVEPLVPLDEDSFFSASKDLVMDGHLRSTGPYGSGPPGPIPLRDRHPFLTRELKLPIHKSRSTQALLADFRARGATIQRPVAKKNNTKRDTECGAEQHFPVLYCNYSLDSSNASFCVSPTVLIMESTGAQDIPLGYFLEKYCFRPHYKCQDHKCNSPLLQHIRKFCHSKWLRSDHFEAADCPM